MLYRVTLKDQPQAVIVADGNYTLDDQHLSDGYFALYPDGAERTGNVPTYAVASHDVYYKAGEWKQDDLTNPNRMKAAYRESLVDQGDANQWPPE